VNNQSNKLLRVYVSKGEDLKLTADDAYEMATAFESLDRIISQTHSLPVYWQKPT